MSKIKLLSDIPAYLEAARGVKVSASTARRWVSAGILGIRLPTQYVGGRPYVEISELNRFFARVSEVKRSPIMTDQPSEAR